MDFSTYKFRPHQLGKILPKDGTLSVGNKTALMEIFIEATTGKRKEITSKYFEKGLFCEQDGLEMLQNTLYQGKLIIKNKERKENDFLSGECDTIVFDTVMDIKNAFDRYTFAKASLTPDYEWQLRAYMWLWKMKKARLFYVLINMPEHMVCDEERKLSYKFTTTSDPEYVSLVEELRAYHNYDDMELWQRFKVWDIKHEESKIEELKRGLIKCRAHLNNLWQEQQAHEHQNKVLMGLSEPSVLIAHRNPEVNATIIENSNPLLSFLKQSINE